MPEVIEVNEQNGVFTCVLPEAGTYTVKLSLTQDATVKGHCLVTVGDDEMHTAAIIGENTNNCENETLTNPFVFTISVTDQDIANGAVKVTFEPRWGVVVEPNIEHQGAYSVSAETEQENANENANEPGDVNGTEANGETNE